MTDPGRAVFLSYASQDAQAAQQLCDALRAAGVEVWFDRSELRGGDAWDRQIHERIRDCRLFVALISAQTEARDEGYFRREWRLVVERTHEKTSHTEVSTKMGLSCDQKAEKIDRRVSVAPMMDCK